MQNINTYRFSKEHIWVQIVDGENAKIGITSFAQSELGEIVFVELPPTDKKYFADEVFGTVEALKTTSDLIMPLSGEVLEVNSKINSNLGWINENPTSDGWLIRIRLLDKSELDLLLDDNNYTALTT